MNIEKPHKVNNVFYLSYTRELPPSAVFPSPSGGVAPSAPPLGCLRRPFGQPPPSAAVKESKKKNWGAMGAPYLGCRGRPGRVNSLAYAAFGGDKK